MMSKILGMYLIPLPSPCPCFIYWPLTNVPAPIKDVASIRKLYFQTGTMVHFTKICLFLPYTNTQNSIERTYFWRFFRCCYYSRASFIGAVKYGKWKPNFIPLNLDTPPPFFLADVIHALMSSIFYSIGTKILWTKFAKSFCLIFNPCVDPNIPK